MVEFGISDEGYPDYEYERVDDSVAVPKPQFSELIENRTEQIQNMIEIGILADELGYDYIVHPEHHFGISGSTSPNPLFLQTYLSNKTSDIRLMQMANILPWHDPIRLARQICVLDVISNGRAEVGIAHGSSEVEANILGSQWGASANDRILNDISFKEKFRILKNQWADTPDTARNASHGILNRHFASEMLNTSESSKYEGCHNRANTPPDSETHSLQPGLNPVQEPHPQLWTPTMKEHSLKWAANHRINGCVHLIDFEKLAEQVSVYHQATLDATISDRNGAETEDLKRGWDKTHRRGIIPIVQVFNTGVASDSAIERWTRKTAISLSGERVVVEPEDVFSHLESRDNPLVGDSADITRGLEEMWETAGYEDRAVFLQFKSGNMSHETHMKQVRSFMRDIATNFR